MDMQKMMLMQEANIRLECVKLATRMDPKGAITTVIDYADELFSYVMNGSKPETAQ